MRAIVLATLAILVPYATVVQVGAPPAQIGRKVGDVVSFPVSITAPGDVAWKAVIFKITLPVQFSTPVWNDSKLGGGVSVMAVAGQDCTITLTLPAAANPTGPVGSLNVVCAARTASGVATKPTVTLAYTAGDGEALDGRVDVPTGIIVRPRPIVATVGAQ